MSGEDAVYELTIDQPNLPKGEQVQIPGLGTFGNGSSYTVTKDEADAYRTYHTRQVTIVNEEDNSILGSDVELGPTLLQASKSMYGVTVETVDPAKGKQGENNEGKNVQQQHNASKAVTTEDKDTSSPTASTTAADAVADKPKSAADGPKTKTDK